MRIKHIDALRGIAAFIVTVFHLTGSSALSKQTATFGKYGYLGIEIFFVISGFVLPYSLFKSGYKLKNFLTFILKRIIRIHPAYIVAILVSVALTIFTRRREVLWQEPALHLVFLNRLFGYNYISAVFWTLAVEFQFYILVGLTFQHFFASNYKSIILMGVILFFLFFPVGEYFPFWFPFFALGILIFNKQFTNLNPYVFWVTTAVILAVIVRVHGLPEALASCFAILFILYLKEGTFQKGIGPFVLWLGAISYSLYLVHWELGRSTVAICRHIPFLGSSEVLRVIAGVAISILGAYLLFRFVEKPSMKLSGKIRYKNENIHNHKQGTQFEN